MKIFSATTLMAVTFALTACSLPSQRKDMVIGQYDASSTTWSRNTGNAIIEGQGVIRTRGGEARTCAGERAFLIPVSEYGRRRYEARYGRVDRGYLGVHDAADNPIRFFSDDPTYHQDIRSTVCDASGTFIFKDLPAGEWWVQTEVVWRTPRGIIQGGTMFEKVTTRQGNLSRVVMTP